MLILLKLWVRLLITLALFVPGHVAQANQTPPPFTELRPERLLPIERPVFPDMTENYQRTVVEPRIAAEKEAARLAEEARIAEAARLEAARFAQEAESARLAQLATRTVYVAPRASVAVVRSGGLVGSYGWARAGGNCVNTAKAYGKNQNGNPSSWYATTNRPFIGAAALFHFNHVGIVSGIHADGSVEIMHENWGGVPQTRFSPSEIRGYF